MDKELDCYTHGLCLACKHYENCNFVVINGNHTTLYEAASDDELERRVSDFSLNLSAEQSEFINTLLELRHRDTIKIEDNEEDTDFHTIHAKSDIVIITKAQYDDMIKEGIKLEKEVESLKEQIKELRAYKEKIIREGL